MCVAERLCCEATICRALLGMLFNTMDSVSEVQVVVIWLGEAGRQSVLTPPPPSGSTPIGMNPIVMGMMIWASQTLPLESRMRSTKAVNDASPGRTREERVIVAISAVEDAHACTV